MFAFAPEAVAYAALVALPALFLLAMKKKPAELPECFNIAKPWRDSNRGGWFWAAAVWAGGFGISFALTCLVPDAAEQPPELTPWFIILAVIVAPVAEELFFRGFLTRCGDGVSAPCVVITTAVIFSLFHELPWGAVSALIFGLTAGIAAAASGSVIVPIILHAVNNGAVLLLAFTPQKEFPTAALVALLVAGAGIIAAGIYKLSRERDSDGEK